MTLSVNNAMTSSVQKVVTHNTNYADTRYQLPRIDSAIQAQCHDLLKAGHKRPSPPIIEVDATPANSDAANHNYETKPPPLPPTRKPPTNNADTTYHLPRIDNRRVRDEKPMPSQKGHEQPD